MIIPIDRTPPGWYRVSDEISGIPLWKWMDGPVYVATRDMDQLLFLGAALIHFDEMGIGDFRSFISSATRVPDPAGSPATQGR